MPFGAMPSRSRGSICCIRFTDRLKPIARRSSSASPPENPATTIAIRSSCSWNSGTPSVPLEHRLEQRMRVGHRLLATAAGQIRMHHVADDGTGTDDGDLDDEVVEMLGA